MASDVVIRGTAVSGAWVAKQQNRNFSNHYHPNASISFETYGFSAMPHVKSVDNRKQLFSWKRDRLEIFVSDFWI